ncbi:MAG: plasmid mobilization relaxosome protein MobC [Bacteroides sp.]|nr:plasmid mobilization relaxosome protein MobC [Bacteroides sp.]
MKKEKRITIRLTEEEFKSLQEKVKSLGITVSVYTRAAILGKAIHSKVDAQMVFELRKIGVNLNQIAKHFNTYSPSDEEMKSYLGIINEIKEHLNRLEDSL